MDQRGFDNQRSFTVTAREAARLLDVKLATLYAYKSRGWLNSIPSRDTHARRYLRSDVERLKQRHDARAGHTAVAANALRFGEPVLDTSITRIDAEGPHYRGHSAVALAESGIPFESVAELLWTGSLPVKPQPMEADGFGLPESLLRRLLPASISPLQSMAAILSLVATREPERYAATRNVDMPRARRLTRVLVAAVAFSTDPGRCKAVFDADDIASATLAVWGRRPTHGLKKVMNATLMVCADHELNASSFAARQAASTGADLHACLLAAIAVVSGPRHGGSMDRVERFLDAAKSRTDIAAVIRARLDRGKSVPGFGHPLYPAGDPRVTPLLAMADDLAGAGNSILQPMHAIAAHMADNDLGRPTIDFGLVALTRALRFPRGAATAIFAIGRTAGWIANVFEQRDAGYLLRPRARYVEAGTAIP